MAQLKLENEWVKNKFIKDVFVVDGWKNCDQRDAKAEPLFSYDWQGLIPYYSKYEDFDEVFTMETDNGRTDKYRIDYQVANPGFPMVQISNLGGKRICAIKMDVAFSDLEPVNSADECGEGFMVCPENGLVAQNKFCVPKSKSDNTCPITALQFIRTTDL